MSASLSRRALAPAAALSALVALVAGMVVLPAGAASAAEMPDVSNPVYGPGGYISTQTGQTFTPTRSGALTRLRLLTSGTTVEIRNTAGNLPTGSALATATVPGTGGYGEGMRDFVFAQPAVLTGGTTYAFVTSNAENSSVLRGSTDNRYAGGQAVWLQYDGRWTSVVNGYDAGFETWMSELPSISGSPAATVPAGTQYDFDYTLGGAPATAAVSSGQLPPGLTVSPAGHLGGVPTTAGDYTFTVTATEAQYGTTASTTSRIIVQSAPSAPRSLVAAGADGAVDLSWAAPADGGFAGALTYDVSYVRTTGGPTTTVSGLTATSLRITGLDNDARYRIGVAARNTIGASPVAFLEGVDPATLPSAPVLSVVPGDASIGVSWTQPSTGGAPVTYEIRRAGSTGWTDLGTETALSESSLRNGTLYGYEVRATNRVGVSAVGTASATPRTVPDAPTTLTVSPRDGALAAGWTPAFDGGAPVTRYQLEVRLAAVGDTPAGAWRSFDSTAAALDATSLTNGRRYELRVRAVNIAGSGAWSSSAFQTPFGAPSAPAVAAEAELGDRVDLSWTPGFDGGSPVTGYELGLVGADGVTVEVIGTTGPGQLATTIRDLESGSTYRYAVRALNAFSAPGAWGHGPAAMAYAAASAPVDVAVVPSAGAVTVTWSAPEEDGGYAVASYDLAYRAEGGEWIVDRDVASGIRLTGLENGVPVEVRVRAVTPVAGPGAYSLAVATTPRTVPAAPVAPSVSPRDSALDVTWSTPADGGSAITSWDARITATGDAWTLMEGVVAPLELAELVNGTAYDIQVRAVNAAGAGPWSPTTTGTPRTVASAPTELVVTPGDAQLVVEWTAPESNGGDPVESYTLQYREVPQGDDDGGIEGDGDGGEELPPLRLAEPTGDEEGWTTLDVEGRTVISGLRNSVELELRVAAVNDAGTGAWSDAVTATPFAVSPVLLAADGTSLGDTLVHPGDELRIAGQGGLPGADFRVELHSEPVFLGDGIVEADGDWARTVTIPADAELGEHEIVVSIAGVSTAVPITVSAVPVVTPPAAPGETPGGAVAPAAGSGALATGPAAGGAGSAGLASTGIETLPQAVLALALLLLGAAAVGARRLRATRS